MFDIVASLAALGLRESERERVLQAAKDRAPPKPAEPVVQVKLDSVKDMYGTTYKADGKGGFINDAGNTYFGEYNNAGVFHGYVCHTLAVLVFRHAHAHAHARVPVEAHR